MKRLTAFLSQGFAEDAVAPNFTIQNMPVPPPWCQVQTSDLHSRQWQYEMGGNFNISV